MKKKTETQTTIAAARPAVKCLLTLIGLFILLSIGGNECFGEQKVAQDVMASWGKKVITRQNLEARIASLPMEYQMRIQTEDQIQEFLEGLIQMEIISTEARAQKLDKDKAVALRLADSTNSILAQEYMKKKLADVKK
jgi:hypothetical protein